MSTRFVDPLTTYSSYLTVAGQSPETKRHRVGVIKRLSDSPLECTPNDLITFLAQYPTASTRNSYRAALKSFYGWAFASGLIERDPSVFLPRVRVPEYVPHPVPDEALARLLSSTHGSTRAVILLMAYCGLRGAEAAAVHFDDFERDGDQWRLLVRHAKGGGRQFVPVPEWVVKQARAYFPLRYGLPAMRDRLHRVFVAEGIAESPHGLRHWYGTTALRQSGNVRVVQQMLRHKSLASTQIYTLVTNMDTSDVANSLPRLDIPNLN